MNDTIRIEWRGEKWNAIIDGRIIASSKGCRGCLVKLVTKLASKSTKYQYLQLYGKDGALKVTRTIGAANVDRNSQEN